MPALLIPVFTAILGPTLAGTAVLGTTVAAIAANVAFTALTLTANFALQSSAQRKAKKAARRNALGSGQSVQQTVRLSVGPRLRHYGRVRTAGALVFVETRAGWVHQCVVFNQGTISEFEEFFVGGKSVLLDADGCVTQSPYWIADYADPNLRSLVRVESRRGYADQPVSAILSGAYPTDWTDDHRLKGLAYAVLACKQVTQDRFQTVYNSQIPAITAIIRSAAVYDPRAAGQSPTNADTWAYSDNPALCLRDYLTVGMSISRSAIDDASFAAVADYCDGLVPLKAGGTEKRYRLAGGYSYDEDPSQVVQRMLDTMRGQVFLTPDGRIGLRAARWIEPAPADAIPDDAILSARIERRQGLLAEFNAVKVIYTSPAHNWQEQQAHTIRDEEAVERLGREIVDETRLPMVFSHTQAQRLAKIELYEDNPEWVGEFVCHGAAALKLATKTVFPYYDADLDLTVAARITRLTIAKDLSTATIGWESIDPEAYAWDPATEEGPEPALPPDTSTDPLNPGPPTSLGFITESAGGGNVRVGLRWTAPERAGQLYDLRWRKLTTDPWQTASGIADPSHLLAAIPAGTATWQWEVRLRTTQGGVSTWAASTFQDTAFTATSILPPTGVTAAGGQENIVLGAVQSASAQAWTVEFSLVADGAAASWSSPTIRSARPGTSVAATVAQPVGERDVYARARSPLGTLTSSVVGPLSATVAESIGGGGGGGGSSGDASNPGGGGGASPGSGGGDPTGGSDTATGNPY
jgi:hypothetical protein